jgi:hypothetical protein
LFFAALFVELRLLVFDLRHVSHSFRDCAFNAALVRMPSLEAEECEAWPTDAHLDKNLDKGNNRRGHILTLDTQRGIRPDQEQT